MITEQTKINSSNERHPSSKGAEGENENNLSPKLLDNITPHFPFLRERPNAYGNSRSAPSPTTPTAP